MKKWKTGLFPLLCVLIVAVAFAGMDCVRLVLPYYRNRVTEYDKKPAQTALLDPGQAEGMTLYPWNLYYQPETVSMEEYISLTKKQQVKDRVLLPGSRDYEQFSQLQKDAVNRYILFLVNSEQQAQVIAEKDNPAAQVRYNTAKKLFFLKNYLCVGKDGRKSRLDLAYTSADILYYHLIPEGTPGSTPEQLENAKSRMAGFAADALQALLAMEPGDVKTTIQTGNPVLDYYCFLVGSGILPSLAALQFQVAPFWNEDIKFLTYNGEILTVFLNSERYDPAEGWWIRTLVLFYSPTLGRITGFCTN